ncbi:carbohydrate sulfotransferase 8-like [Centroberyx affinis]|uniref:carbohydrate sulfotransferase 8-like n=1 Tax=Centroberyx affinis TaxID=166261 RepID=UPI003A5C321F
MESRLMDALCSQRRRLAVVMKLPCSLHCPLWFLMMLGATCLLLLVYLKDLTEVLQQQTGANLMVASSWPVHKDFDTDNIATGSFHPGQTEDEGTTPRPENLSSSLDLHQTSLAVQQLPDSSLSASEDQAASPKYPVPKRHRKLLLKSNFGTSSTPTDEEEQQQQQIRIAKTQVSRQRTLTEFCVKYQSGITEQLISGQQLAQIYVDDKYRLLYCEVPKVGCSNWKRVLMILGGSTASSIRDIPHNTVHTDNHLRRLESYSRVDIDKVLHSYTKLLFVREPFERLVSAFRDKFESPNSYYHHLFGRQIIDRYRPNATLVDLQTGDGVTFREFVLYLLDVNRPVGMDIHWEPVSQLCNPCLLQYNFIGKFESIEEEANFLLQSIGAPSNLTYPNFKDRNPLEERTSSKITESYFAQLTSTERQKVYDFYYTDYVMFNFTKPFNDLYQPGEQEVGVSLKPSEEKQ